jgi:hypothetical protein
MSKAITKKNIKEFLPNDIYVWTEFQGKPTFELRIKDGHVGYVYEFLEDKMTLEQLNKHISNIREQKEKFLLKI